MSAQLGNDRLVHNTGVMLLDDVGEWVPAAIGLGVAFGVASLATIGLGWWVLRGDAARRRQENLDSQDSNTFSGVSDNHG